MKDHDITSAARTLRTRLQQQGGGALSAADHAQVCELLEDLEDLGDRVTLLEKQQRHYTAEQRRFVERMDFLYQLGRIMGAPEDWSVPDPDETGALATAAPACAHGASGPAGPSPPTNPPDSVSLAAR